MFTRMNAFGYNISLVKSLRLMIFSPSITHSQTETSCICSDGNDVMLPWKFTWSKIRSVKSAKHLILDNNKILSATHVAPQQN